MKGGILSCFSLGYVSTFFFFFLLIKGNVSTAHCLIEPILNRQYIS
jgi:hypothetical protein